MPVHPDYKVELKKLEVLNDLALVALTVDEFGFGTGKQKQTAENGILIALPDKFDFFGFWSFAFEDSFMNTEKLEKLHAQWEKRIGKRVYWTALSERGNIIERNGKKYVLVKLTSLLFADDPDIEARNVHEDGAGSFGLE